MTDFAGFRNESQGRLVCLVEWVDSVRVARRMHVSRPTPNDSKKGGIVPPIRRAELDH